MYEYEIKFRKYLKESESINTDDFDVEDVIDSLSTKIDQATASIQKRQNESIVGTVVGIILSTPFLLKMIGKIIEPVEIFLKKNSDNKDLISTKINEFAEEMEHKLESPLIKLASTFSDELDTQKKFADSMIAGILAILLIDGGVSTIKAIKSSNISHSLLYTAKSSITGTELSAKIGTLISFVKKAII